jgi:hypothetical protein
MSDTVYVIARGDRYHARAECSGITGPHKTALTQGLRGIRAREGHARPGPGAREGRAVPGLLE